MPPPQAHFQANTAFAGAITAVTGALGTLWPEAGQWIAAHASVLLLTAGLLQILLRKVSHGQVILFPETDGL